MVGLRAVPARDEAPRASSAQVAARVLWRTGSVVAAAAAAGAGATGWWTSRVLTTTPSSPSRWPVVVTSVEPHQIRLAGPGADLAGTYGLWWPGGYGRILPTLPGERRAGSRPLAWLEGTLRAGTRAGICAYAWPDRPEALRLEWGDVLLGGGEGETGEAGRARRAWRFGPAANTDWVLFVHGRGSLRAQSFRAMPTVVGAGWSGLAVTYRGGIEDGGGRSGLGAHEWQDLEHGVRFALESGARRIVLAGFSMGGGIVSELLHRSPLAEAVTGVVLDAPVLDWGRVLAHQARRMRLPGVVVPLTLTATRLRAGSDPRLLDQLHRVEDWTAPVLLVHGTEDAVVPVTSSDLLAEARPDLVTYLRVPGAGHVTSWNADPESYEAALADFLVGLP
jgi:alpha-beta hydrolase superfamily lysophospholipase